MKEFQPRIIQLFSCGHAVWNNIHEYYRYDRCPVCGRGGRVRCYLFYPKTKELIILRT